MSFDLRTEYRVLTYHGGIHMATIPADSPERVFEIINGTSYRCEVQYREVGPWRRKVLDESGGAS